MTDQVTTGTEPTATPAAPQGTAPAVTTDPTPPATPAAAPAVTTDPTPAAPTPAQPPSADDADLDEPVVKETDWAAIRAKIANGDEKVEKRLARYSSIDSVVEALFAAQKKIAEGGMRTAFPKDGTPEDIAAWRKENGVPEKAEGYDLQLDDGVILGEADEPIVNEFLGVALESNMTPAQVNSAVNWYMNMREQEANAIAENDANLRETAEESLRELWGAETKLNKQVILNHLKSAPDGLGDLLLSGRLGDGSPIFSNVAALRWFADQARTINPMATITPTSGQNVAQALEDEISSIEKMMRDRESDYWKGDKAPKIQERYRQLLDTKQRASQAV